MNGEGTCSHDAGPRRPRTDRNRQVEAGVRACPPARRGDRGGRLTAGLPAPRHRHQQAQRRASATGPLPHDRLRRSRDQLQRSELRGGRASRDRGHRVTWPDADRRGRDDALRRRAVRRIQHDRDSAQSFITRRSRGAWRRAPSGEAPCDGPRPRGRPRQSGAHDPRDRDPRGGRTAVATPAHANSTRVATAANRADGGPGHDRSPPRRAEPPSGGTGARGGDAGRARRRCPADGPGLDRHRIRRSARTNTR